MTIADSSAQEPQPAQPFLPRPGLVARLAALSAPLIVLAAPVGSGKSMALLAYAREQRQRGLACHWLAAADLAMAPRSGTLLLHQVSWPADPAAQAALMAQIRARLPRQRLLVALDQPLPQLLRDEWIAGRAALVGARDLAFQEEDAAALFGAGSSTRELRLLLQFAEGWPLGLALLSRDAPSALALMRRDGARLPLPRALGLWFDDWLGRSPAALPLLLDLAVFERFPAGLLAALPPPEPGTADRALLRPILAEGLFLRDCEQRPGWFRFMPALARHLRDRLTAENPARAAQIRRFALEWSAEQQDASGRLRHGLAVWSPEEALAQVDAAGAISVSLASGPDLDLGQPISAASVLTAPLTFVGMIYERMRLGAFDEARVHYENAVALAAGQIGVDSAQDPQEVRGWIELFSAVVRVSADTGISREWRIGFEADLRNSISRFPVLAVAQGTVAMLLAIDHGERETALALGRLVLQLQERTRADKAAIFIHLHLAAALIASARLDEAQQAIAAGQQLAGQDTYADSYELISCQILAGLWAYETGDAANALALLEPCHEHFPRIHGWRRNWFEYFAALAGLAHQARGRAGSDLWIGRGQELARLRDQPQLGLALGLLQLDLALQDGQTDGAAAALAELSTRMAQIAHLAPHIGIHAQLLTIELLLAEDRLGEAAMAHAALDRAAIAACDLRLELRAICLGLELACRQDQTAALAQGLAAALALAQGYPRLARLPQLQARMRAAHDALLAAGLPPPEAARAFFAPRGKSLLSPREGQIIVLIAEGLSTKEIARSLGTSEGTVKSHRKNLYEKLGVSSRSRAIARARELQLLPG